MATRSRAPGFWLLLLVSFFILLYMRSHPLGLKEIAFWMGRCILILALVTFIVSVVTPYFNSIHISGSSQAVPQEENEHQQAIVRKEQQELLSKKASEFNENILKPRKEEKLKKLEERFYKMTGQTWKLTEGYTLGEIEDQQNDSARLNDHAETANKEAIRKRKLPENVRKPLPQCEQPQPKRVITLPEEPNESEEDVLLDWMMKIGYHPVLYSICTPMPRCPLQPKENVTLENIGIIRHTALNIEEKDPS
ncbi:UBX domain-containing protein 8 isoform X2 [Dendropsophus ebraccatus]|uniref:UBX domain-containing protein 8 isoform X2 n=1 Tax=Dendropsophus ebraccatus TaxID=150705 RepID=UPI003831B577